MPRSDLQTIHDHGEEAALLSARQAAAPMSARQTGEVDALTKTQEIYVYEQEIAAPADAAGGDELLMGSPNMGKDNISFAALDNSTDSVHIRNADNPLESPLMSPQSIIMAASQRLESSMRIADVVNMADYAQPTPRANLESHDQPCFTPRGNLESHVEPSLSQMPTSIAVPEIVVSDDALDILIPDNDSEGTINQPITPPISAICRSPITPPAANRRDTLQPDVEVVETERSERRDTFQPTPTSARDELLHPEAEDSLTPQATRTSIPEGQRTPATRSSWQPSELLPLYGLDAELKAKAEAKYDLSAEDEAGQWVEEITGVKVVGEFGESLRTGQVLCQLINSIKPGTIRKINVPGRPFKERENITMFIKACRDWGVHEYALFSTDDLYDEKNLSSVVKCIHQLGGVLRRAVPEFQGPHLGVADCSNAKRDAKRALAPASQTEGFRNAMGRAHIDILSTGNVRRPMSRGGC
jgi:hypothetical protein